MSLNPTFVDVKVFLSSNVGQDCVCWWCQKWAWKKAVGSLHKPKPEERTCFLMFDLSNTCVSVEYLSNGFMLQGMTATPVFTTGSTCGCFTVKHTPESQRHKVKQQETFVERKKLKIKKPKWIKELWEERKRGQRPPEGSRWSGQHADVNVNQTQVRVTGNRKLNCFCLCHR